MTLRRICCFWSLEVARDTDVNKQTGFVYLNDHATRSELHIQRALVPTGVARSPAFGQVRRSWRTNSVPASAPQTGSRPRLWTAACSPCQRLCPCGCGVACCCFRLPWLSAARSARPRLQPQAGIITGPNLSVHTTKLMFTTGPNLLQVSSLPVACQSPCLQLLAMSQCAPTKSVVPLACYPSAAH